MRVTKGDIVIECADQAELRGALLALSGTQSDFHPLPGVHVPGDQYGPLGTAEVGEYISADDERRLRLVESLPRPIEFPSPLSGPPVDLESPALHHVPVSRKCLDVLDAVLLFPEGVYAKGIAELVGITVSQVCGRLQMLRVKGLVDHPHHNRNLWRATNLARRSKLVAC